MRLIGANMRGAVLWVFLALFLAAASMPAAYPGGLVDTDGYMHLLRAQQVLDGGWNGGVFARDGAPAGLFLHWTAPFDLLVVPFAAAARLLGLDAAGTATLAGLLGPLCYLAFCGIAAWAARPFGGQAAVAAGLAAAAAPNVLDMGGFGRVDHHLVVAALGLGAVGCAVRAVGRGPRARWAVAAGSVSGASVWLSVEALPMALLASGLLFAARGNRRVGAAALAGSQAAWAAVAASALAIDPTLRLASWDTDRLSGGFLILPAVLSLSAAATAHPRLAGLPAAAAAFAAGLAAWALAFPAVLAGARGVIGDDLMTLWWAHVPELHRADTPGLLAFAVLPSAAAFAAVSAVLFADRRRPWAAYLALYAGGLAALACAAAVHIRFGLLGAALAAPALGAAYGRCAAAGWWRRFPGAEEAAVALLAAPIFFVSLKGTGMPHEPVPGCSLRDVGAALRSGRLLPPGAVVMVPYQFAPELVFRSGASTVAGPYQRNAAGLRDEFSFFRTADEREAERILASRRVDRVMACGEGGSPALDGGEGSMYRRLAGATPPDWLVPVPWPDGTVTRLVVYAVSGSRR